MFRKTICILVAVLFCLGAAAGCSGNKKKENPGVSLSTLKKDVANSAHWQDYGVELISCDVIKRQTNPEDKIDYVFTEVVGESDEYRIAAYYKLTYVLSDEGWLLEELIPDPKKDPIVTKRQVACLPWGPQGENLAIVDENGVVTTENASSADGLPVIEGANVYSAVAGMQIGITNGAQSEILPALLNRIAAGSLLAEYDRIDIADPSQIAARDIGTAYTLIFGSVDELDSSAERFDRIRGDVLREIAKDTENGADSVTVYLNARSGVVIAPHYPASSETPAPTADPVPAPETADPGSTPALAPDLDAHHAQVQRYLENGAELIAITAVVPGHSTLTIAFPYQDDYTYDNTDAKEVTRKVKMPIEIFYPNEPLTESELEYIPEITITNADGSSYRPECPAFVMTFPKLHVTVNSPVPDENGMITASESNVVRIEGVVDDPGAEVTANGQPVHVYEGGMFVYDYVFPETATEDDVETLQIIALKNNCVSGGKTLVLHAYRFVPDPMMLEVASEGGLFLLDDSGKLIVTGRTLPGAKLSAISDDPTKVLCGSVPVADDGSFSFQITADSDFSGVSFITLSAEKDGAEPASLRFRIVRGFADKDAFVKHYLADERYLEIHPNGMSLSDLLDAPETYAGFDYGFRITATVVEVLETNGDVVVRMTLNKTNETVYVHSLSPTWAPADNIGGKFNVYCSFTGTYADTGCAEFLGWFAKKP